MTLQFELRVAKPHVQLQKNQKFQSMLKSEIVANKLFFEEVFAELRKKFIAE